MTTTIFFIAFASFTQALIDRDRELENRRGRCKMPIFTFKLPQNVRSDLQRVWSSYTAGDDCTAQRFATNQILKKLPDEMQERLFVNKKNDKALCSIPPFFDKLPLSVQQKLFDIWSDYVIGEDCNTQLQSTRIVLVSISSEQWQDLRPRAAVQ
uniref:Uncharacterized protein n=1 Tax=Plectus sambesii TaxID=2011161 RepID=A0A914WC97_9BILA